jgi:hypothetical protein
LLYSLWAITSICSTLDHYMFAVLPLGHYINLLYSLWAITSICCTPSGPLHQFPLFWTITFTSERLHRKLKYFDMTSTLSLKISMDLITQMSQYIHTCNFISSG